MEKGDYSRAILEFRNAMQAMPRHPEPYYQIALASLSAGDVATGVASLRKTLEIDPKHQAARLRLAQIMSIASDNTWVKEGETRLRELVAESPDNPEVLNSLAFAELRLGKTDEAIHTLDKALQKAPKELSTWSALAQARLASGDAAAAEKALLEAVRQLPRSVDARIALGLFYVTRNRLPDAETEFRKATELDAKSARALFNLARLHNTLGRKQEAEDEFRRMAALGNRDFRHTYGIFLFEQGRRDEAIKEFERLFRSDPDDRVARTRLIVALRTVGRQPDAAAILSETLKTNPSDAEALTQRAAMLVESGEFDRAETDLNKVFRLKPDAGDVHFLMARVHTLRGNTRSARMELSDAVRLAPELLPARIALVRQFLADNEYRAASDLLDKAPEWQKRSREVLTERNWVLWVANDLPGMRKGIDAAMAALGRTPELLLQDGMWNLRSGKPDAARAVLEQALKLDPSDVRSLQGLNAAYAAQKQGATAVAKVREYASSQPKSPQIQEFLGLTLLGSGDINGARQAFESAKAADPKYVRAEFALTQIDVQKGDWEEARKRMEKVLAGDGTNLTARLWLAHLHTTKGEYGNAVEQYRQVVNADSSNAEALNNLAYLLTETGGEPSEALKYAQKARELRPQVPEYGDTLGWTFYKQGMYSMAVRELERVAERGDNPVWKYHLAMAYAKAGDLPRGKAMLKAARDSNPNLPEARIAAEMLGEPSQAKH
jgi:Tfp pilus assembly protein PilF